MMDENITTGGEDLNRTFNETTTTRDLGPYYDSLKWVSLLVLVGDVVFNTVVIVLLFISKRRTRMGFFVKNLAFADLAVGLFYILPETVFSWFEVEWDKYVCYFYYGYFSIAAYYVSSYAIVVLTIDRLYVIIRPVSAVSKGKLYRYGLGSSAWLVGLLLAIQYAVHVEFEDGYCFHKIPYSRGILFFDLFAILIVPVTIITLCYSLIVVTIWRRARRGFVLEKKSGHHESGIQSKDKIITTAKIKTIKLLFVVVLAYVLCWSPITIAAFLVNYDVISTSGKEGMLIYSTLFILAPVNSLSNPLLFFIFNRKMFSRQNVRKSETRSSTRPFSTTTSNHVFNNTL